MSDWKPCRRYECPGTVLTTSRYPHCGILCAALDKERHEARFGPVADQDALAAIGDALNDYVLVRS
jgi:hypothetical protein